MRLLELFSGTGSVGEAFRRLGWEVTDLDIRGRPAIKGDILEWDYKAFEPGHFDAIHASPPCQQYSRAKTTGPPRDLLGADALVQRALDIIGHLRPRIWMIENPLTGLLKDRDVMKGLDGYLRQVTYCKYGFPYRKSTAIWTNLGAHWEPRPLCGKANPCELLADGRHPTDIQKVPVKQRYRLPPALCGELASATLRALALDRT